MALINLLIHLIFYLAFVRSGDTVNLHGGGASLPSTVYTSWFSAYENYRLEHVQLDTDYKGYGSGEALGRINNTIWARELYMVDIVKTNLTQLEDVIFIPALAGVVVLSYHIVGVRELTLTTDVIIQIFNETVNNWNDSAIKDLNPEANLPDATINVIVRGDQSGTTEIFTAGLSRYSTYWNATYGTFSDGGCSEKSLWKQLTRNCGITNRGSAGLILSIPNSVGYISIAEALESRLKYATILDNFGNLLEFSEVTVQNAMRRSIMDASDKMSIDLVYSLSDFVHHGEYPFIGYSYIAVREHVTAESCAAQVEIVRFIEWYLTMTFPSSEAWDHSLVPLIDEIGDIIMNKYIRLLRCNGLKTWHLAEEQKHDEWWDEQTWVLPICILIPSLIFTVLGYICHQQYKFHKAVLSDQWKIPAEKVIVKWCKLDNSNSYQNEPQGVSTSSVATSIISSFSTVGSRCITVIGTWEGHDICGHEIMTSYFNIGKSEVKKMLFYMKNKIQHANVLRFFGITSINNRTLYISELARKGTLSDVIQNDKYNIDLNIMFSFAIDIAAGMEYLHWQNLIHGMLTQESCYVDQRWNVKIADWQNHNLGLLSVPRKTSQIAPLIYLPCVDDDPNMAAKYLMWSAPEVIERRTLLIKKCTKSSDTYSFAIIMVEIFTRDDPYNELQGLLKYVDIIDAVEARQIKPNISDIPEQVCDVIHAAWDDIPEKRPSFSQLRKTLLTLRPSNKSIIDAMMDVLDEYVHNLEDKVQERTAELAKTNENLETLLHQILPASVAEQLMKGEPVQPESYDNATIFFSDIVEFTSLSARSTPMEIVVLLNKLYNMFDLIIGRHDVYKVETIGDAYMCISGLPHRNGIMHASHIATMALDFMAAVEKFAIPHRPDEKIRIRAGIHSGPVVSGVVGSKMPRFCLFGDSVNTASRMESTSKAMKIQVSETTYQLLCSIGGFVFSSPQTLLVKGKGDMTTYFLLEREKYKPEPIDPDTLLQHTSFYTLY